MPLRLWLEVQEVPRPVTDIHSHALTAQPVELDPIAGGGSVTQRRGATRSATRSIRSMPELLSSSMPREHPSAAP
jgi:hypothetical protein